MFKFFHTSQSNLNAVTHLPAALNATLLIADLFACRINWFGLKDQNCNLRSSLIISLQNTIKCHTLMIKLKHIPRMPPGKGFLTFLNLSKRGKKEHTHLRRGLRASCIMSNLLWQHWRLVISHVLLLDYCCRALKPLLCPFPLD